MTQDNGASLRDRAVVNGAGQAVSAVPASVPSADYFDLIAELEDAPVGNPSLDLAVGKLLHRGGRHGLDCLGSYTQSLDSALTALPEGADWRKLTHPSISVYAANPYNANAQKRFDGNGSTPPLQMCAAALRLYAEPALKAETVAARKAQGIAARSDKTGTGLAEGKSPVGDSPCAETPVDLSSRDTNNV